MRFKGMANKVDYFLHACFDLKVRRKWDISLTDHRMCGFVVNNNMIVIENEVETMVNGYNERECIYKQFHWCDE